MLAHSRNRARRRKVSVGNEGAAASNTPLIVAGVLVVAGFAFHSMTDVKSQSDWNVRYKR